MAHVSVGQAAAAPAGKAANASSAKGAKKASTQITAPNATPSGKNGHLALAQLNGQLDKNSIDLFHKRNEVEWKIAAQEKKNRKNGELGQALGAVFEIGKFLV